MGALHAAADRLLRCRSSTMSPHRLRRGASHPAHRRTQFTHAFNLDTTLAPGSARGIESVKFKAAAEAAATKSRERLSIRIWIVVAGALAVAPSCRDLVSP